MTQKIGLEVANGFIKVVSTDTEITYPNKLKPLTGREFNVLGDLGVIYEYEGRNTYWMKMALVVVVVVLIVI